MTDDLKLGLTALVDELPPLPPLPPSVAVRGRRRRTTKLAGLAFGVVGAAALALPLTVGGNDRLSPEDLASPTPSVSAPSSPVPSASSPAASPARVDLVAEGLRLSSGSSSRPLDFGQSEDDVVSALSAVLRDPAARQALPDCGPTTVSVSFGRFSVYLVGGTFRGWRDNGAGLTTADGLGVGSTLAEVRAARADVTVTEGTLGTELTAGGLSGLLERDVVTSLAAGETCLFR